MQNTKQSSGRKSAGKTRQQQNIKQQGRQSGFDQLQEKYPPDRENPVRNDNNMEEIKKEAQEYGDEKTASEIRQSIGPSS